MTMVAPIVEAGRRAKPMAMACAQDPKDRENTEVLGTMVSRSRGSTPGPGKMTGIRVPLARARTHMHRLANFI